MNTNTHAHAYIYTVYTYTCGVIEDHTYIYLYECASRWASCMETFGMVWMSTHHWMWGERERVIGRLVSLPQTTCEHEAYFHH